MTDFATLLQPDRGRARPADPRRRQGQLRGLGQAPVSAARQTMLEAIRFDGKSVFQFAILPGRKDGDFDVVTCVDRAGDAVALVPRQARRNAPRRHLSPRRRRARHWPRSAGCSPQHRFDRYKSAPAEDRGARDPADRRRGGDRPLRSAWPKRPRWSATWSIRPPPTWARPSSKQSRRAISPRPAMPRSRSRTATRSPRLSDDRRGRRRRLARPRAAADRAALGQCRRARASRSSARACASISGGLDIKPAAGMRLMKKDMGGAAHALRLARLVIGAAAAGPASSADPGGREYAFRRPPFAPATSSPAARA